MRGKVVVNLLGQPAFKFWIIGELIAIVDFPSYRIYKFTLMATGQVPQNHALGEISFEL